MKKQLSVFLSFLLVLTLLLPIQASAKEDTPFDEYGIKSDVTRTTQQLLDKDGWQTMPKIPNVKLNHEWKINFSGIATADKVQAITIEHNKKLIPLTPPTYNNKEFITVKPVNYFVGEQDYTLKILLVNGKKYKMDFTTEKRNPDTEPNNTYLSGKEIYVDETFKGNLLAGDKKDFYQINVPEDGLLNINIQRLNQNTLSLYLYGKEGENGDLLAYTEGKAVPKLSQELKKGVYYIQVVSHEGTGGYEVTTSFKPRKVDQDKALLAAQKAVKDLPSKVDIMVSHNEAIKAAAALVASAKILGADVEKLEKILTELQEIALVASIESLTMQNSTTFEIRFNRAVDVNAALFNVSDATVSKVSFNQNKTVAKLELNNRLKAGSRYIVSVEGLSDEILTKALTVEPEKVTFIEILSDHAIRETATHVSVNYTVGNQYGEDITDDVDLVPSGSNSAVASKGKVTITVDEGVVDGSKIGLTLTHTDPLDQTKVSTSKTVKVSTEVLIEDIKVLGIYDEASKKFEDPITETTKLGDSDSKLYLLVEAKDQYGSNVGKYVLNTPNTVHINQTNLIPSTAKFEEIIVDGKSVTALRLTGTPKAGQSTVVLTAVKNKKTANYTIIVDEDIRADKVEFGEHEPAYEGEDLVIPISVYDKTEKLIDDADIVNDAIRGIKVTNTKQTGKIEVKKEDGKLVLMIAGSNVKEGKLSLKAEFLSGKNTPELFEVVVGEKAKPTSIKAKEDIVILEMPAGDKSTKSITDILIVEDQHGRIINDKSIRDIKHINDIEFDLSYVASQKPNRAVTFGRNEVIANAVGNEKVRVKLEGIEGTGEVVKFTVTDNNEDGFISYEVEPVGTIYDYKNVFGLPVPDAITKYNKSVEVYGIYSDGGRSHPLDIANYTVVSDHVPLNDYLATRTNVVLNASGFSYRTGSKEIKTNLTVTIGSSGEKHVQNIVIAKEKPKVDKIEASENIINYDIEEKFDFEQLLAHVGMVATDKYGVQVELDGDYRFEFPDGTAISSAMKLSAATGGVKFNNNSTEAVELPLDSSFKAVVSANGVPSSPIVVNVNTNHTPDKNAVVLEAERMKNELEKMSLVTGDNVLIKARELIPGYTVKLNSRSDGSVIAVSGGVTQPAIEEDDAVVDVEFTVTKGAYSKDIIVNLIIKKTPQ